MWAWKHPSCQLPRWQWEEFATPGGSKRDFLAILLLTVRDGGGKSVMQMYPSLSLFAHKQPFLWQCVVILSLTGSSSQSTHVSAKYEEMPPFSLSTFTHIVAIGTLFSLWKRLFFFPQCSSPWAHPRTRRREQPFALCCSGLCLKGFQVLWISLFSVVSKSDMPDCHIPGIPLTLLQGKCCQKLEKNLFSCASACVLLTMTQVLVHLETTVRFHDLYNISGVWRWC